MIYNDRTVRGVILARLSVMEKNENEKGKFGCEQGRIWRGRGVTDYGCDISHQEIEKRIIRKYYDTTLAAYDNIVQGIAPNFQIRRQKSEETTFGTAKLKE